MFSQGYIGVSAQGLRVRYLEHKNDAANGSPYPIHAAIRKYGDKLIAEVVLLGSPEYCFEIEAKLRPSRGIGYNIAVGGIQSNLGAKHTEETKKKMQDVAMAQGRKPSKLALDNSAKTNSAMKAWLCKFSNKNVWKMADQVFKIMEENPKFGYRRISTILNTTPDQLSTMYKKIKSGWDPNEDKDWLIFSGKLTPESSGDKPLQTGDSPTII